MRSMPRQEYLLPFATIDDDALMQATTAFAEKLGKIEKQPSPQIDFHAETTPAELPAEPAELKVFELDDPYELARRIESGLSQHFASHRTGNNVNAT